MKNLNFGMSTAVGRHSRRRASAGVIVAALAAHAACAPAQAQCSPRWYSTAGVSGATGYNVSGLVAWDPDGAGPQAAVLVLGGEFTSAGGVLANNVAIWNGSTYSPLGSGVAGAVNAVAVLPDGRLVVAGGFASAGGVAARNVAAWDGHAWAPLGTGFDNVVWALAMNPVDGKLYAGGIFTNADGAPANRVARWDGTAWTSLGTGSANGVSNIVYALTPLGSGDMVVGGNFTAAGGVGNRRCVARFTTAGAWATMAAGMNAAVLSLGTLSDDSVVAGGIFTFADIGPASRIARWDGTHWNPVGAGTNAQPLGFLALPNGQFIAGGHFVFAGTVAASKAALWDGTAWSAMGTGMDNYVIALARMPGGDIFAGGGFSTVDGVNSPCLARWASEGVAITEQPTGKTVCAAHPGSLTVGASGVGPLAYGWQVECPAGSGTFVDLSGSRYTEAATGLGFDIVGGSAAMATLALSGLTLGSHAPGVSFRCTVTNLCGSVASAPATLLVCYANCDCSTASPMLTANDFQCFLNAFASGSLMANCDGSTGTPALTANDFQCFINSFAAGCPR